MPSNEKQKKGASLRRLISETSAAYFLRQYSAITYID